MPFSEIGNIGEYISSRGREDQGFSLSIVSFEIGS